MKLDVFKLRKQIFTICTVRKKTQMFGTKIESVQRNRERIEKRKRQKERN